MIAERFEGSRVSYCPGGFSLKAVGKGTSRAADLETRAFVFLFLSRFLPSLLSLRRLQH